MLKSFRFIKISGFVGLCVLFIFALGFAPGAHAFEEEDDNVTEAFANFDLSKNEIQEHTFIDESGKEVTIGIEPIIEEGAMGTFTTLPMGRSTWNVYWYTGAVNQSYKINVNRTSTSTRITNAYDLNFSGIGYSITRDAFWFNNSQAAFEGTATIYGGFFSMNIYLKSSVSGNTLTVDVRA